MTLHQKVEHLIGQWDGSDAAERSGKLGQLARDLVSLVQSELRPAPRRAPAGSAERATAPAAAE